MSTVQLLRVFCFVVVVVTMLILVLSIVVVVGILGTLADASYNVDTLCLLLLAFNKLYLG